MTNNPNDHINFMNSSRLIFLTEGGKKMVAKRNNSMEIVHIQEDPKGFDYLKETYSLTYKEI